ncbi:transporter membrane subunit [Mycobacterium saskatchewanense]|uniref:Cytosine permease n=1 Tax=Mycobacterium saskatchewanense TaxID=220927 RepID=A0AAJ3NTK4_9MYCO|nr:cytosine permease [Mycobacterium saskatchewanense]ORW75471.1 cytosine permease [Mycobacterium saskatchewanense]BBX65527.1 transporter membrane subunit [Mycobacterium saskatchewanense]
MAVQEEPKVGVVNQIELHSIDYVPLRARHGRLVDQTTIWFACFHPLTLVTGAIGIGLGLNLIWTLLGVALGTLFGTIPVSIHATQGPHLGLPQMVQTRPQFGRYGALFIWVMAIVVYWGYLVVGGNIFGTNLHQFVGGSAPVWAIVTGVVAIVLAIFGYRWLHSAQRIVSIGLVIVLVIYIAGLAVGGYIPGNALNLGETFQPVPFAVTVSAAMAYQLSWAFFVSDYSRYMPPDTNRGAIILWTSIGLYFSVFAYEAVGAMAAAMLPGDDIIASVSATGDHVFPGLGTLMLLVFGLGLLGLMGMCVYGGSLTLITAIDSIRPVDVSRSIRVVTILLLGGSSAIAGAFLPDNFLNTVFLVVLEVFAYLMAPWTSVNLTDFFIVRRGHYSVREIFKRDGIYGRWNWRGIMAYTVTFLVMIPFMHASHFEGPISAALGGIDVAFFVGVPVGCLTYWLLCRNLDMATEREVVKESDRDLEPVVRDLEAIA